MLVKELIKELNEYDPDGEICIAMYSEGNYRLWTPNNIDVYNYTYEDEEGNDVKSIDIVLDLGDY